MVTDVVQNQGGRTINSLLAWHEDIQAANVPAWPLSSGNAWSRCWGGASFVDLAGVPT